jgi:HSP20 family molecular chaperone IbpA
VQKILAQVTNRQGEVMPNITIHKVPSATERTLPVFKELDDLTARTRERAFELYCGRGFAHGHALDDWLAAERELCWPAGELRETIEGYVLSLTLPGFEPDEVAITATPREIIVHAGAKTEWKEEAGKEETVVRWSEYRGNDVYRRVEVDQDIDVDKVSATLKNGLLTIVAAKGVAAKRVVPVAAAA